MTPSSSNRRTAPTAPLLSRWCSPITWSSKFRKTEQNRNHRPTGSVSTWTTSWWILSSRLIAVAALCSKRYDRHYRSCIPGKCQLWSQTLLMSPMMITRISHPAKHWTQNPKDCMIGWSNTKTSRPLQNFGSLLGYSAKRKMIQHRLLMFIR